MVLTNEALDRTEAQVLETLAEDPSLTSPRALIDRLKSPEVPETLVRAAIWYLIDGNRIQFTMDRQLRLIRRDVVAPGDGPVTDR